MCKRNEMSSKRRIHDFALLTPYMQGLGIFSWIFIIIFFLSSMAGIGSENPMLVAMGAILMAGMIFFEMFIMKDQIKELSKNKKRRRKNEI